jgi:protein SCO1/2
MQTTRERSSVLLLLALLMAAVTGCAPEAFIGSDVSGASYGRDFRLQDHTGRERTMADYRGKAVVLFFGYTNCPDVCPSTLAEAARAMQEIGPDAERVQVVFVTVDPDRDTADLLANYVPAFHPGFVGLRGDARQTAETTASFRVFYARQPGSTPESYTIDHSAGLFVFDPQGRLRLYHGHGTPASDLAHDLRLLLAGR